VALGSKSFATNPFWYWHATLNKQFVDEFTIADRQQLSSTLGETGW
jgi:hypothetical protein